MTKTLSCAALVVLLGCSQHGETNDGGLDGPVSDAPSDALSDSGSDVDAAPVPAECKTTSTWGAGTLVSVSTPQADFFGAVTPDELTIAWMTTAGSVLYADRTSSASPFGAPQTLSGAIAFDHVTLTADGLTLIVVKDDRYSLAQATRSARGSAFGATLDTTPYAELDPLITEFDAGTAPPHGLFSDPMLSPDGTFLYYSQYGLNTLTMLEAYRAKGDTTPWTSGRNLLESQLRAPDTSGKRMHPTGISSDNLTLFYWDDVASSEKMAFRDAQFGDNTYNEFIDIGAHQNAAPVNECTRIYFSASGDGGPADLFFADSN